MATQAVLVYPNPEPILVTQRSSAVTVYVDTRRRIAVLLFQLALVVGFGITMAGC